MTPPPPGPPTSPPPGANPAPSSAGSGFAFDIKRLSQAEWIAGGATILLFISLFLPWYTVSYDGGILGGSDSASGNLVSSHGWAYLILILCLVVIAYLVLRAGFEKMPFTLPLPNETLLLIVTGVIAVLTIIAFFVKPSTGGFDLASLHISIGWGFGAFVGLIAAIVAVVPLAIAAVQGRGATATAAT
jgi:hypothetical protein